MKTLIVGDIHGKVDVVEQALAQEHPVVFVGDILDSYDRSVPDHLKCLDLILRAIDAGKAQCLLGNHELSYLYPHMRCSGHNSAMQFHLNGPLGKEVLNKFKSFIFVKPNVLLTHAGLDKSLWDEHGITLENLEGTLNLWVNDVYSPAYQIGYSRGGTDSVGGIFWCDFRREHTPIPELIQILGHTRGKTLRTNGTSTCIDYNDYQIQPFYYDL